MTVIEGADRPTRVDAFIDPMCPWAYQGSRWLREVRARHGVEVRWRFFSLEEINREDGKKHPWERDWSYGWSQMRVGAFLRRRGDDAVDRWYAAVGRAFFEEGRPSYDPVELRSILAEAGFEPEAVDEAVADPTTAEEVRADHDFAHRELGAFGVPTLWFRGWRDEPAVYGPSVVPAPMGEEADRLWEVVVGFAASPRLYELRRPKRDDDLRHLAGEFATYLDARAWRTIENPAP